MKANSSKKTLSETSFDQLDWKNGSLSGNGLKQAVDMFKAQDASKQTAVIYDRKTRKTFNILDVRLGKMNSGHGIEIDIDTSKEIQEESEKDMKENKSAGLSQIKKAWDEAGNELKGIKTVEDIKKKIADSKSDIKKAIDSIEDAKLKRQIEDLNAKADIALSTLHEGVVKNTVVATLKLFAQLLLCLVKLVGAGLKISGLIATVLVKGVIKVGKGLEQFADKKSAKIESDLNEATDTIDQAADGYGKGNSEQYTWKVLRKIFPNLQFNKVSSFGPGGGWPEIKVSGKDRDVRRFMDWWNSEPNKDHKFWKKIMDMLEKIYGKPIADSEVNEGYSKSGYDVNTLFQKLSKWNKSLKVKFYNPDEETTFPIADAIKKGNEILLYPYDIDTGIRPADESIDEADDNDPLSHALDVVGVKASTANSKAQDEVQMTATDGGICTGIDAAIDRDIDAAMEEIYK